MTYQLHTGDCLEVMRGMPADSVDLVLGSPPYEDCRTYGIDFNLKGQAWVDWMFQVFTEARRVSTGLVAMVLQGKTKGFRWSATPALLMADLHRAGFCLRNPPIFHRVGIPGSGGPDWLRGDTEFIVCTTRGGKLPFSDNTAMGHAPKWAPGGEMSYRNSEGTRKNQWGGSVNGKSMTGQDKHGNLKAGVRPSHKVITNGQVTKKYYGTVTRADGSSEEQNYKPPDLANPGNLIHCNVGGGLMGGDEYCSHNEAPYPEALAEFFVRSFCQVGGTVLDPFSGSGTTGAVSLRWQRNYIGIDIRQSQVDLSRQRLENETPMFKEIVQ